MPAPTSEVTTSGVTGSGFDVLVLDDLVAVHVPDPLAGPRGAEAPSLPAEHRLVDVDRALVDARRLGRGRALDEALLGQVGEDLALVDDLGVDAPGVQREPRLGGVVPHLDAQAVGDVLGVEERRVAAGDGADRARPGARAGPGSRRAFLCRTTVKPSERSAVGAAWIGSPFCSIAEQARDRPEEAVELERGAVGVHVEQREAIGVAEPQPLLGPVARSAGR